MPPAKAYVIGARRVLDIHDDILDMIAKDDHVIVRDQRSGTEAATGTKYEFSGIVI